MDSEPTPRRLQKALARGDSPLAPGVARFAALGVVVLGGAATVRALVARFDERLKAALSMPDTVEATSVATDVLVLCAPLLGVILAVTVVVGLAQTGGAVVPPWSRARGGLSALFSGERWFSALRAVAVTVALFGVALLALRHHAVAIADSGKTALPTAAETLTHFAKLAMVVLAVGAILDVLIRRSAWRDRWRLTPEAAKQERRDERAPELVRVAQQRAREELMQDAPATDE